MSISSACIIETGNKYRLNVPTLPALDLNKNVCLVVLFGLFGYFDPFFNFLAIRSYTNATAMWSSYVALALLQYLMLGTKRTRRQQLGSIFKVCGAEFLCEIKERKENII